MNKLSENWIEILIFSLNFSRNCVWKCRLWKWRPWGVGWGWGWDGVWGWGGGGGQLKQGKAIGIEVTLASLTKKALSRSFWKGQGQPSLSITCPATNVRLILISHVRIGTSHTAQCSLFRDAWGQNLLLQMLNKQRIVQLWVRIRVPSCRPDLWPLMSKCCIRSLHQCVRRDPFQKEFMSLWFTYPENSFCFIF